jgi:hypothetical protein
MIGICSRIGKISAKIAPKVDAKKSRFRGTFDFTSAKVAFSNR